MPTAVLDVDLEDLPPEITGLERYARALVLLRFSGKPVGQKILPVFDGRISNAELQDSIVFEPTLWKHYLHAYLDWDEDCTTSSGFPAATVAVCTRDRTEDLQRCLDALMRLENLGQEYLVVDNCPSRDATRDLVSRYDRVRYIREQRPGLNVARNRALREAQNDIVAFTDDDATPDPFWLQALVRNFRHPLVLGVTGLTMPVELETRAQECFELHSRFGRGFRRKVFSSSDTHPMASGQIGAGVNVAFRRQVLEFVGPFDEALDAGTPTHSGGDNEMFSRILLSGYRIVYDPAALNWHRHRRSWEELRKTMFGYGSGVYAAWTRSLLIDRQFSVLRLPLSWMRHKQIPALLRAILRRPGSVPLDLILAELGGCAAGPWAYVKSRRRLQASRR